MIGLQRLVSNGPRGRYSAAYRSLALLLHGTSPLSMHLTNVDHFSMVVSLFWLGWTSWGHLSPIVPAIGGCFFGLGFQLLFMGMTNYVTDVFRQMSASAQAAASTTRSIGAILLPLAANSMYSQLGIHWAPSLLGFLSLAMGIIPFVFIQYGDALARRSKYSQAI